MEEAKEEEANEEGLISSIAGDAGKTRVRREGGKGCDLTDGKLRFSDNLLHLIQMNQGGLVICGQGNDSAHYWRMNEVVPGERVQAHHGNIEGTFVCEGGVADFPMEEIGLMLAF